MAVGSPGERSLKETPTWAVALVCAVFVIVSVIIEYAIHSLGKIEKKKGNDGGGGDDDNERRKLLSYAEDDILWRRALASAAKDDYCAKNGKVSLISYTGVHQLHIFIFVLAVFHVLYSVITIALARAKMKKWKAWELETSSFEYQFTNDPTRFRFTRQTSFVKRHSGISRIPGIRWIVAFFRQFFGSVTKVDYMTMRHGFINILLLVGTKMELIIMEMAQEIQDRSTVVKGAPIVEPSNKYFWFNRPDWILLLIHFTLFQMGSHMKQAIFEEQTARALKNWQKTARARKKQRKISVDASSSGFMSGENTPSQGASPLHLLHAQKHRSTQSDLESVINSPRSYQSDTDLSDLDSSTHDGHVTILQYQPPGNKEEPHSMDFSFVKP
ncbi:MLO protein-1-like protein [Morus notabilis]|uniref:MLO protein-1-like protein n=1 Tax=Morus notabilis TaxID=981085 RepID=W9R716_9ROSA|nr:MLO protein-1-like protein [Morus notabilis]